MHNLVGNIIRTLEPMSRGKTVVGLPSQRARGIMPQMQRPQVKKDEIMAGLQLELLFEMRFCIVELSLFRLDSQPIRYPLIFV